LWDSLFGGHLDEYSSIENWETMVLLNVKARARGTIAAFLVGIPFLMIVFFMASWMGS
jgi:hypothetical protein